MLFYAEKSFVLDPRSPSAIEEGCRILSCGGPVGLKLSAGVEEQISSFRTGLSRRTTRNAEVDECESELRREIKGLVEIGLTDDEAILVAVKRMGRGEGVLGVVARELRETPGCGPGTTSEHSLLSNRVYSQEYVIVFCLALLSALAFKIPALFGVPFSEASAGFYVRNFSLFVLPVLTGYFAWRRRLKSKHGIGLLMVVVAAVIVANVYPFRQFGSTELLMVLHLPIALWLVVGMAYVGGRWRNSARRMDFVRFSGELFVYFTLFACGGVVLTVLTVVMFNGIGVDVEWFVFEWLLPCGALGAVIVGAGLIEIQQKMSEGLAPLLTRLFTPLFAVVLLMVLATMAWTSSSMEVDREVLIGLDFLLVVVLGLHLFYVSERHSRALPSAFDWIQLLVVCAAVAVDALALVAIADRISEFGVSPNKLAALGENLLLFVNLLWSGWLYAKFLRGRGPFADLKQWQVSYLPVYSIWAGIVVVIFPPVFGYA